MMDDVTHAAIVIAAVCGAIAFFCLFAALRAQEKRIERIEKLLQDVYPGVFL